MNNLTHAAIIKDKLSNLGHKIAHKIDNAVAKMVDDQIPTLENPVKYKVCHRGGALVREGYDTTTPQVAQLNYGESIVIVELVGRRARMIQPVYGWVSLRTKDGVKILEQKHSLGKVSVRNDKGFEKAFDERFQKVRSGQLAEEHERRKQMEEREEDLERMRQRQGGGGGQSSGDFFADFGGDADSGAGGPVDLLGGLEETSPTKKVALLEAPRVVGDAPIPRLGAPGTEPIAAPAKKKASSPWDQPFQSGGATGSGSFATSSGGEIDLLDGGPSSGGPSSGGADFFSSGGGSADLLSGGSAGEVPFSDFGAASAAAPQGGADLLFDFGGSGSASSGGFGGEASSGFVADFGDFSGSATSSTSFGGAGGDPFSGVNANANANNTVDDLLGGGGSNNNASASGGADLFFGAPQGIKQSGPPDLLGGDGSGGFPGPSIILTDKEAEAKKKEEKSNDIDLDLFG